MTVVIRFLWLWGPPLAEMVTLYWLSSRSDLARLPGGVSDKFAHFVAYAVLAGLSLRAAAGGRWAGVNRRAALVALAVACGYGALDELHQVFTPGRFAGVDDWVADALGALSAIALGFIGAWIARRLARTGSV